MGGLGILSVTDTAAEAYVRSVALVSGSSWGPTSTRMSMAFPFFQADVDSIRPLITPLDTDQSFDLTQQAQATLAQAIAEEEAAVALRAAQHFVLPNVAVVEGAVVAQPGPVVPVFPVIVQPPPAVIVPAEPLPAGLGIHSLPIHLGRPCNAPAVPPPLRPCPRPRACARALVRLRSRSVG
jgi:hypothetical protein